MNFGHIDSTSNYGLFIALIYIMQFFEFLFLVYSNIYVSSLSLKYISFITFTLTMISPAFLKNASCFLALPVCINSEEGRNMPKLITVKQVES